MILLLGGTHECKWVCDVLKAQAIPFILSVATDYGKAHYGAYADQIVVGKMDVEALKVFIQTKGILAIIDITHPHAELVKNNAKCAADAMAIPYHGFCRSLDLPTDLNGFEVFDSMEAIVETLRFEKPLGKMLITGTKHLEVFCAHFPKEKLFFRVMPSLESIGLCEQYGIRPENIIAIKTMPQTLNNALLEAYDIDYFIFKNSGVGSAFDSNIKAVRSCKKTKGLVVSPQNSVVGLKTFESEQALKRYIELIILEGSYGNRCD